jgi:hypothetical protein
MGAHVSCRRTNQSTSGRSRSHWRTGERPTPRIGTTGIVSAYAQRCRTRVASHSVTRLIATPTATNPAAWRAVGRSTQRRERVVPPRSRRRRGRWPRRPGSRARRRGSPASGRRSACRRTAAPARAPRRDSGGRRRWQRWSRGRRSVSAYNDHQIHRYLRRAASAGHRPGRGDRRQPVVGALRVWSPRFVRATRVGHVRFTAPAGTGRSAPLAAPRRPGAPPGCAPRARAER